MKQAALRYRDMMTRFKNALGYRKPECMGGSSPLAPGSREPVNPHEKIPGSATARVCVSRGLGKLVGIPEKACWNPYTEKAGPTTYSSRHSGGSRSGHEHVVAWNHFRWDRINEPAVPEPSWVIEESEKARPATCCSTSRHSGGSRSGHEHDVACNHFRWDRINEPAVRTASMKQAAVLQRYYGQIQECIGWNTITFLWLLRSLRRLVGISTLRKRDPPPVVLLLAIVEDLARAMSMLFLENHFRWDRTNEPAVGTALMKQAAVRYRDMKTRFKNALGYRKPEYVLRRGLGKLVFVIMEDLARP
ncbi:hypothetical protein CASFOL_020125 [Castilleja foliolosa]|uniref:Uncharacterized protein n=1 Tax=Castilleja foliolosa TaxID=1961234 RepID=A0ABD3CZY7_9LAMI